MCHFFKGFIIFLETWFCLQMCVCVFECFCEYIDRWCWWPWRPEVSTGRLISSLVSRLCPPHLGPIVFVCMVMTGDVTTIRYQAECDLSFPLSVPFLFLFFFFHHCDPSVAQKNARWFISEIHCQKHCFCIHLHKRQSDKCWKVEEKKPVYCLML